MKQSLFHIQIIYRVRGMALDCFLNIESSQVQERLKAESDRMADTNDIRMICEY